MESEDIRKTTGCKKPCFYKRYNFIGEKLQTYFLANEFVFSLWAVSNYTMLETEQLIYPLASLVAEFGGTLSLFLGFSFLTVWDSGHKVAMSAFSRFSAQIRT